MIDSAIRLGGDAALWVSASPAVELLAKVTLVLAAGLVAARLAFRTRASIRHAVLAASLLGVVAIPVITALGFVVGIPVTSVSAPSRSAVTAPRETSPASGVMPGQPVASSHAPRAFLDRQASELTSVWLLGSALAAAPLTIALWRLRTLRRRGRPCPRAQALVRDMADSSGISRRITVVTDSGVAAPFTFGTLSPVIVLPESAGEWDSSALARALFHELAHVRRGDWWTQVVARTVCAFYWFHPLTWRVYRQMSVEAERACDDEVVARAEQTQYADQLVALARRMSGGPVPLVGMANRSDLATRVAAVLDTNQPRGRMRTMHIATIVFATIVGLAAIAPARAVARVAVADGAGAGQRSSPSTQQERRVSRLDRALVEAVAEGDLTDVTSMLDAGANVNAAVDGDGSPLIAAARAGDFRLVTFLLDRGADVNLGVEGDGNPLIMAAAEGYAEIVELLLSRGADVNAVVPSDENALIQASSGGHLAVVQLLVSRGADVNARIWADNYRGEGEWRSALSAAQRGNHRRVVEYLKSVGAR